MKNLIARSFRKIFSMAATGLAKTYVRKDRAYQYKGLRLVVYRDVFHPGLFRSTKFFAGWIEEQEITGKKILEIGSGSGLLSLVAARKGAVVTAVDINPKAVLNTKQNAAGNHLSITTIHSDLFTNVKDTDFDLILINPPYYAKQPRNDYEKAWYCGEHFDYFHQLFEQLNQRNYPDHCYMVLSDTCDLEAITKIAHKHALQLSVLKTKSITGEQLVIYKTGSLTEINSES